MYSQMDEGKTRYCGMVFLVLQTGCPEGGLRMGRRIARDWLLKEEEDVGQP